MASSIMSKDSEVLHWDSWDFSVKEHDSSESGDQDSNTGSAPHEDRPKQFPRIKQAKVKRFLSRQPVQEAFMSMDSEEQLKYVQERQKVNDEKNEKAREQKWYKGEGGRWEKWSSKWYWMEWKYQQRWLGPY